MLTLPWCLHWPQGQAPYERPWDLTSNAEFIIYYIRSLVFGQLPGERPRALAYRAYIARVQVHHHDTSLQT